MTTLAPISNLTSLTDLQLYSCGKDLRGEGLETWLTQGHLTTLVVFGNPKFFVGWEPQDEELLCCSSKLQTLKTDDLAGVLVAPICTFLSSSLTKLYLNDNKEVELFTREQEDALQLLTSLQDLQFWGCNRLQSLPAGLHRLPKLEILQIGHCPAIRSLPEGGLPRSLQTLVIWHCNDELKQHCRKLEGTIPQIFTR